MEKPETYVSNIINAGAYLFSTEVFKHMAQAFDEHHKTELVECMICYCCVCARAYVRACVCVCSFSGEQVCSSIDECGINWGSKYTTVLVSLSGVGVIVKL